MVPHPAVFNAPGTGPPTYNATMNRPTRKRETATRYEGRYLGLLEQEGWEYATRTNATGVVVIVAVTTNEEVVLVEQHRVPVANRVIELPAGLVGDQEAGESLESAAERELFEETGYCAARLRVLTCCPSSAGMSDEEITFFLAEDCVRQGAGGGDASEDITVHTVPLRDIDRWLAGIQSRGLAFDPKIYAGLYWLDRRSHLDVLFPGFPKTNDQR